MLRLYFVIYCIAYNLENLLTIYHWEIKKAKPSPESTFKFRNCDSVSKMTTTYNDHIWIQGDSVTHSSSLF